MKVENGEQTYEDNQGNTLCKTCKSKVEGGYCNCLIDGEVKPNEP